MNQPLQSTEPGRNGQDAVRVSHDKGKELEESVASMRDGSEQRKAGPAERFSSASHARKAHRFILPKGDTLKDALETDYWVHVASQLGPLDHIEINPDDDSFYAELLVRSNQFGMVVTAVIAHVKFGKSAASRQPVSAFKIEDKGPHLKWCVTEHDKVLMSKLQTQEVAATWLRDYRKTAGA